MELSRRLEVPTCYQTQHFVIIELLLILMLMPGDLKIEKKIKNKQTNKRKRKVCPLDFVIMENEIRAASKHVRLFKRWPCVALSTWVQLFKRWIPLSIG